MFDAIVVGGGVVGAATALLLAREVFRVLVVLRPSDENTLSFGGFARRAD
jgi:2-polyprenyl-6-methoxyphenol hydroxylase-like FAD-dependent oxidoreductase